MSGRRPAAADSFSFKTGIILNYKTCPKTLQLCVSFSEIFHYSFSSFFSHRRFSSRFCFLFPSHPLISYVCLHHCRFLRSGRTKGAATNWFSFLEIVANTDNGSIRSLMAFFVHSERFGSLCCAAALLIPPRNVNVAKIDGTNVQLMIACEMSV